MYNYLKLNHCVFITLESVLGKSDVTSSNATGLSNFFSVGNQIFLNQIAFQLSSFIDQVVQ